MSEHGHPEREMGNPAAAPGAAADCDEAVPLTIHVEPFGPDQARIDRSIAALLEHPRVRDMVAGRHSRRRSEHKDAGHTDRRRTFVMRTEAAYHAKTRSTQRGSHAHRHCRTLARGARALS